MGLPTPESMCMGLTMSLTMTSLSMSPSMGTSTGLTIGCNDKVISLKHVERTATNELSGTTQYRFACSTLSFMMTLITRI